LFPDHAGSGTIGGIYGVILAGKEGYA